MATQLFNFNAQPSTSGGGNSGASSPGYIPMPGSNQFGSYGTPASNNMPVGAGLNLGPNQTTPGVVPNATNPMPASGTQTPGVGPGINPYMGGTGSSQYGTPLDPQLTTALFNWLQSQVGQGVMPFNLSALMPSSGQATQPGQLTAPMNQMLQQLQKFYQTGQSGGAPGLDTLASMSATGNPIDQMPAWKAMVEASQRGIKQGSANLKEQFNVGGGLVGSPYGTAAADYEAQSAKDLNAQLIQAQTQAQESAQGRRMGAASELQSGEAGLAQFLQGLDQQSIQALYQEFMRTQPQYNPLLNMMYGGATTFPQWQQKPGAGGSGWGQTAGQVAAGLAMML